MKKIILAAILAGIGSTAAWAADVAAPVQPVPAQVYNWTGFYVGADARRCGCEAEHRIEFRPRPYSHRSECRARLTCSPIRSPARRSSAVAMPDSTGNSRQIWWLASKATGSRCDRVSSFCRETTSRSDRRVWITMRGFCNRRRRTGLGCHRARASRLGRSGPVMLYGTGGAAFADVKSSVGLNCPQFGCGEDFHIRSRPQSIPRPTGRVGSPAPASSGCSPRTGSSAANISTSISAAFRRR